MYGSGEWEVDLARRELRARGFVPVGGRAFEIIEILVQSAGELVTKDELMGRVWPGAIVEENTLQVHISAVRKAFGPDRGMLKTASGRGYRLLGTWTIRQESTPAEPVALRIGAEVRPGISDQSACGSVRLDRPCDEARWLAVLTASLLDTEPEAWGLTALLTLAQSRAPARTGTPWPALAEQDTSLWDRSLIAEGEALLRRAHALGAPLGRFQLEAAIQSAHCDRARTGTLDRATIVELYRGLVTMHHH